MGWVCNPDAPSPATACFWNFDDGARLREVAVAGGKERAFGVFSADSRFFVLIASDDKHHMHLIDARKAGGRTSLTVGERVVELEKAVIASSFTADGPINSLCLLDSGEIAAVGIESKAIVIWKIKTP